MPFADITTYEKRISGYFIASFTAGLVADCIRLLVWVCQCQKFWFGKQLFETAGVIGSLKSFSGTAASLGVSIMQMTPCTSSKGVRFVGSACAPGPD